MNKTIYIIGTLAVLAGMAMDTSIPIQTRIALDGLLLIFANIVYRYFY